MAIGHDRGTSDNDYNWDLMYMFPHFTGALSMFGSGWIMLEVLLDRGKRRMAYHRLMFAMSFFDFFSSSFFFASKWAQEAAPGYCIASGFFVFLGGLTIPPYSAALLMYYYLCVCRSWQEEEIKKRFERYVHIIVIAFGITMALIPIFLGLYHPWYFYCFPFVNNEAQGIISFGDSFLFLFYSSVIICTISMIFCFSSIILKLRRTSSQKCCSSCCCCFMWCHREKMSSSEGDGEKHPLEMEEATKTTNKRALREEKRARVLITMPFLYMIPFTLTWIIPTIMFLISMGEVKFGFFRMPRSFDFIFTIYISIALPLQGFINWIVYIYRRGEEKFSRLNRCSLINVIKATGELFLRILNVSNMEDDNDCLLGSGMEYTFVDGDDSDGEGDCEFHHTALEVVVTDNNINAENLDGPDEEDDDDCLSGTNNKHEGEYCYRFA